MHPLTGQRQSYDWGSPTAIPGLLGTPDDGQPFAELWFGTHPAAPSSIRDDGTLADAIAADPADALGDVVVARFGPQLPFLLTLIAPARPLSLQVHPALGRAQEQFAAENAAGIPLGDQHRHYRDPNHKPELLYALTDVEAVCGFRTPRRAAEIVSGLGAPVMDRIAALLLETPNAHGMRAAFRSLLAPHYAPPPVVVQEVADACAARLERGDSPSPRMDAIVVRLNRHHPGDPGVLAAMLLNPVSLRPGESIYIPPGDVHAYMSGLGVEVMAASDNVLRAGLTSKAVNVDEMLANVSGAAAPPMRIAGEHITPHTQVFYAPVDDFELSITALPLAPLDDDGAPVTVPGTGPRIALCISGDPARRASPPTPVASSSTRSGRRRRSPTTSWSSRTPCTAVAGGWMTSSPSTPGSSARALAAGAAPTPVTTKARSPRPSRPTPATSPRLLRGSRTPPASRRQSHRRARERFDRQDN